MSRICGVIAPHLRKDAIRLILEKMTSLMQHEPWHRIDGWCDDGIGLGHTSIGAINEEIQPIRSQNSEKRVVSAGKIVAYEERKQELLNKGYRFDYPNNDAEFAMHLYEEYGVDKFGELNGVFAFSIWDSHKKELILVNDRYGMRPLYYFFNKNKKMLLFGSELKTISRQDFFDKKIDWDAWNIFLRIGFLVGEDTFYKNIRTLPQGSVLHFDLASLTIKNYWNYGDLKTKSNFNEKEDIDNVIFHFKQSIKRRIIPNKKTAVFLSGGLDSRGIAAELKHQEVSFTSFTIRRFFLSEDDRKLAAAVARKLDVKNISCDLPFDFLESAPARKNAILDYESDENTWILPLLDAIPGDFKINYDGIANDLISDPMLYCDKNKKFIDLLELRQYDKFITDWLYGHCYSFLRWPIGDNKSNFHFFTDEIRLKFSSDNFIEKIKSQILKFEGNPNQYILFMFNSRTRREISLSPFQLILNKLESLCPYLDNDYFEYVMSLPISAKKNMSLRSRVQNIAYPELSRVNKDFFEKNTIKFENPNQMYHQKIKDLLRMERGLLGRDYSNVFNYKYLIPRFLFDYFLSVSLFWKKEIRLKLICERSHYFLVSPVHFLHSWLISEGISEKLGAKNL